MSSPPLQPPLAPPGNSTESANGADERLRQLRVLLVGPQQEQIAELRRRIDTPEFRPEDLSGSLAEAIAIRSRQDRKLQTALQPLIEEALRISVARDPALIATSLFPIIGEAVRKAVGHALQGMFDSLNQMLGRGLSFESWRWRFEAWRSGKSFGQIALTRSLNYRVEQVFLIHRETGLLLAHDAFQVGVVEDADLVSAMLTAIQDFVRDSFGPASSDELEVLHVGAFKLWLQHGPLVLLAAVVSGQPPPELRELLVQIVEDIHRQFGHALHPFNGDTASVAGIEVPLRRCLLGGQRSKIHRSYKAVWTAALLIFLTIAMLAAIRIRDNHRWTAYVDRLRAQPGIVVIDERRHWVKYSVSGLRDPLAIQPHTLLAGSGLPARRIVEHWEPYLSLNPAFEAARQLDINKALLERQVIHFALDSAQLPAEQMPVLDEVELDLNTLRHSADANHSRLQIRVFGHTDRSGKEDRNVELSRARAETVVGALEERGIPRDIMLASGVADTSPGHAGVQTYPQELDRRVSFQVLLAQSANPSEAPHP